MSAALAACGAPPVSGNGPNGSGPCLPDDVLRTSPADGAGGPVRVYLDGSLSMAGYVDAQTSELRPLGDILSLLPSTTGGAKTDYFAFGKGLRPVTAAAASAYASATPYRCAGAGCDNAESRIDLVLQDIQQKGGDALSVVVTDLWLSSGSIIGSPQVALGEPLARMLEQGRAVGVLGVRAPYAGPIYDLPSGKTYTGARERPLFVLLIGPEARVSAFKAALLAGGSPAFAPARARYSLFARAPDTAWATGHATPLQAVGTGVGSGVVTSPPVLTQVRQFRISLSEAKAGQSGIEGQFDAAAGLPDGAVWQGPLKGASRVWLMKNARAVQGCAADAWTPYSPLQAPWRPIAGRPTAATFRLDAASGAVLTPGRTYLVAASLGSGSLTSPNPAAVWMRQWGFNAADEAALTASRPAFFKVLNLGDLAAIMEQALQRAAKDGQTTTAAAFLVKVEH